MCDVDSAYLVAEFRKTAATFKPVDVLKWNGMSWDYLTIALVADDISDEDHQAVVKFARSAMVAAAVFDLGLRVIPKLVFSWGRRARGTALIKAMANTDNLPPEPGPSGKTSIDLGGGPMEIDVMQEDKHRLRRRRAVTAKILMRLEDPSWKPKKDEMLEIYREVGARALV